MRVLVVVLAAIACIVAKPAAADYAYSAVAPLSSYPYASAYHPLAYSGVPAPYLPYAGHAPFAYAAPAPVGVKSQYHAQDFIGQATYGHAEPGQVHHAVQDAAGNKVGSFSYVSPEGKFIQTSYVADAAGYRVASNDLPVAPVHNAVLPAPVADTPEVVAARAAHLAEVEKASRSKRSVTPAGTTPLAAAPAVAPVIAPVPYAHPYGAYPYGAFPYAAYPYSPAYPHAYPTTDGAPVTLPEGYNADTPEVVAAKANHFAEHAAAKARTYSGYYPYIY